MSGNRNPDNLRLRQQKSLHAVVNRFLPAGKFLHFFHPVVAGQLFKYFVLLRCGDKAVVPCQPQVPVDKEAAHFFAGHIVVIGQSAARGIVHAVIYKTREKIQFQTPDVLTLFLVEDHQAFSASPADRDSIGSLFVMYFEMSPADLRFHNRLLYF